MPGNRRKTQHFEYRFQNPFFACSELNEANIPNLSNVMEAIMAPFRAVTPNSLSAVPFDYGTTGIAYNTKYVTESEAKELGANLLLKKELKGKGI